jgi:hypothetical protein
MIRWLKFVQGIERCGARAVFRRTRGLWVLRTDLDLAAAVMVLAAGCTSSSGPSQVQIGFDSIRPGQTTDADVIALMGDPSRKTVHNVAGVELQVLQFADAKATYSITIGSAALAGVGPRVISKDMEPRSDR